VVPTATPLISTVAPDGVLVILSVSARVREQRHIDTTNQERNSERDGMPNLARIDETTQAEIAIYGHTCVWKIIR
jgi:hypothetical protein